MNIVQTCYNLELQGKLYHQYFNCENVVIAVKMMEQNTFQLRML